VQPNATVTALVVLLYMASSLSGMRTGNQGTQVPSPPGINTTQPTPQTEKNVIADLAGRSAALAKNANVRTGPGENYPVLKVLPQNTPVRLIAQKGSWFQISLPSGGYGWVASSLVNMGSSVPASGSGRAVVGYYTVNYSGDKSSYNVLKAQSSVLTAIAPFSYSVDRSGKVTGSHFADAMEIATSKGLKNLALVHNMAGSSFSKSEVSALLNSQSARAAAVKNIARIVAQRGYDGVNIDFENVPPADRTVLTKFMKELAAELRPKGYLVTMSVPAKHTDSPKSAWIGAFDYHALGQICDQIMLMTYDEHTSGTSPGPVASLPWVEKVIKYATSQIPKHKVIMGVAAYGYDWNTKTNKAKGVSYSQAISTAAKHGAKVQWDNVAQVPYYTYKSGGVTHKVYFESTESLKMKLKLVDRYDIGGIALWRLGQEDDNSWKAIETALRN
jgi:spore germination protein